MNSQSIFDYVKNNIDENGWFTSDVLPDDMNPPVPRPLGAEDAYFYTTEVHQDIGSAEAALKLFRQHLAIPCLESKRRLSDRLSRLAAGSYCDVFLEKFAADELTPEALELAEDFLYNSTHREPVKFAMILFGLYGMENIKENHPDLWQDLFTLARCEEFTFFFLYACRLTHYSPQEEIWQLLQCTNSWGKVYSINAAEYNTPDKQQWLIENGYAITIDYPPISIKMIVEGKLSEALQADKISYDTYKGAAAILNNFLLLLNNFAPEVVEQNFNTSSIDLEKLLTNFLRHAKEYATTPKEILDVITLSIGLNILIDSQNWHKLSPNQCHSLVAICDSIIYQKDWQEEIDNNIITDEGINYPLCDFAYELDFDIWPRLFAYFRQHPAEIQLLPYLLAFTGDDRSEQVLNVIEANIYLYLIDKDALLVPLRYLNNHPGEGIAIIIAALTSLYDWPRGIACMILDDWGPEYLTPALRNALISAQELCQHPLVKMRIEHLLAGKKFKIENLLDE